MKKYITLLLITLSFNIYSQIFNVGYIHDTTRINNKLYYKIQFSNTVYNELVKDLESFNKIVKIPLIHIYGISKSDSILDDKGHLFLYEKPKWSSYLYIPVKRKINFMRRVSNYNITINKFNKFLN